MKIIKTDRDEALLVHYVMLTRQITRLADCLFHIVRLATQESGKHGSANLDYLGYRAYAKTELADVLCQVRKLCDVLSLNFNEILNLGIERDKEKKETYLKDHPKDEWV